MAPPRPSEVREFLRANRWVFFAVAVFSFVGNFSILVLPFYMMQVFTRVLSSRSLETLVMLSIIVVFLLLVFNLIDLMRNWTMQRVSEHLDNQLATRVFTAVYERSLQVPGGGHAQALRDLASVRQFLTSATLTTLLDAPWTPLFLLLIFFFDPLMGYIALFGALVLLLLAVLNELVTRGGYAAMSDEQANASNFAEAGLRNAEAIRAMGMYAGMLERWQHRLEAVNGGQRRVQQWSNAITTFAKFFRILLQIAVMSVGVMLAIDNHLHPGVMIAATILLGRALAPVQVAVAQWRQFAMARQAFVRLDKLLRQNPPREASMPLSAPTGALHVDNITVLAPVTQVPLLQRVQFRLEPGAALGIIGPSGAGKTTLARALLGIWRPASGSVRLDGIEIAAWSPAELGPYLGYLPQDVELLDGSVAENIARFRDIDPAEVERAARRVGIHDMIARLPEGYDTQIGEGGAVLSAGQRQRIGLARAIYRDPVFIVLDEPNASLDTEGEVALSRLFAELKDSGTTLVVIAHRPTVLHNMDSLLMLKNGTMGDFGSRQQVLKRFTQPPKRLEQPHGVDIKTR